ncbi:heat shock protein 30C-like [Hyla sarda]|uniref:heat shock protein 30C-like n=1 Tax=Hyla sarda TaxID=327740 RepID=UPI0024C32D09|nr:heat shock protein 30C-like [Hyla sarda]
MFPLSLLQPSHSPLCVQPPLTLWPAASHIIFGQLEDDMRNMGNDLERRMQRVNQAYQLLDMDMRRRAALSPRPEGESSSVRKEGKENYELTLDIGGFSPEELTVKTEGRRLIVSGKRDKKKEDEHGGYFHEYREWRREAELPEDVNPEDLLCSLSKDGRLTVEGQQNLPETQNSKPHGEQNPLEIQNNQHNGEQNPRRSRTANLMENRTPTEIENNQPYGEQKEDPSNS